MKKYNISEARKNFTSIIKDAEINKETIMITNRSVPVAYVIDSENAKKYLPKEKFTKDIEPNGARLAELLTKFEKENKKYFKNKKQENVSGNIDKILYGT